MSEDGPALTQSPPRAPDGRLALASLVLVFLAYLSVASVAQLMNAGFGVWFSEAFIFLGLSWVLVAFSRRDPWRWTGFAPLNVAPTLFGFALGAVNFFAVTIPLQFAATHLFPESWTEYFDSARIFQDRSPFDLALILAGVTVAAPIGEEYFFRGVFQNALARTRLGPWKAMGVAAFVFSAFHFDPVGFAARLELGLLFGWLFWRTRSIWPGVMAHAANNGITSVLFFASRQAKTEDVRAAAAAPAAEGALQVVLLAVTALIALAALLWALQRRPSLLAPVAVEERPVAPRGFFQLCAPWAAAAAISVTLLLAFDWRGVRLNVYDAAHPLPARAEENRIEMQALSELRSKVRTGHAPFDEYKERRRALIERSTKAPRP